MQLHVVFANDMAALNLPEIEIVLGQAQEKMVETGVACRNLGGESGNSGIKRTPGRSLLFLHQGVC
jgi:hypothetical protein